MGLVAVAPLLALGLLWVLVHGHREGLGLAALSTRGSLAVAFVLANGLVVAVTELTSVGRNLTAGLVGTAWVVVVVVLAVLVAGTVDRSTWRRPNLPTSGWVAVGLGAAYVAVLGLAALAYRPATSDSMMYHLPRVEHWVQNATVAPYATHFPHQVEMAPLHEYSMLQLHLLAGTDRLDGLVSLVAYVVAVLAVTEATRLLGGDRTAQLAAGVIALTLPSAVLQASGTHNDLFAGAVSSCLLVVLLARPRAGPHLAQAATAGLAVGLALLAKATLLPTVAPALAALAAVLAVREARAPRGWRRLAAAGAVAAAAAVLVAGPFLGRNAQLTGSVLGSDPDHQRIAEPTVAVTAANTVRHLAGNFRIGDGDPGPQTAVAEVALRSGWRAFDATGVAHDDQRYALGWELDAFELGDHTRHQRTAEYGANPVHAVLAAAVVASTGWALVRRRGTEGRWERWYRAALAGGLVVGLVALAGLLRWQMYATRFQIAPLLVFASLSGLLVARWHRAAQGALLALLVVASVPMALANTARPLVGDDPRALSGADEHLDHYVLPGGPGPTAEAYASVAQTLAATSCSTLGLANRITFEYPLWVALDHTGWEGTIVSIDVTNDTAAAADPHQGGTCAVLGESPQGVLELRFPGEILL